VVQDSADNYLNDDILSIDASMQDNGNTLVIIVSEREALVTGNIVSDTVVHQLDIFLDVDQNPLQGNSGIGYPMGCEYKVSCFILGQTSNNCALLPIQTQQEAVPLSNINGASDSTTGNTITIRLPRQILTVLDDQGQSILPTSPGVDLFAIAYNPFVGGTLDSNLAGIGDRAPETGVLDSSTGQAVLRRTDLLQFETTVQDQVGDVIDSTKDVTSLTVAVVDDQLMLQIKYAMNIQLSTLNGIFGTIFLDTDTILSTGTFRMGSEVPAWGIDYLLIYSITSTDPFISLVHSSATAGTQAQNSRPFGPPFNDGRWFIQGQDLVLIASLSVFDPFFKLNTIEALFSLQPPSQPTFFRVNTNGHISALLITQDPLSNNAGDQVPSEANSMIDFSMNILQPSPQFPNNQNVIGIDDPVDSVENDAFDILRIETAIVEGPTLDSPLILFRVFLKDWLSDDTRNEFEILLDLDNNPQTGDPVTNPDSNTVLGADLRLIAFTQPEIFSVSNPNPNGGDPFSQPVTGYHLQLQVPPTLLFEFQDSMFFPFPRFSNQQSASSPFFVVSLPMGLLRSLSPTNAPFVTSQPILVYVTAGEPQRSRIDIAPPQPLQIILPQQQQR